MHKSPEIYFIVILGIILGLVLVGFIVAILFLYQRRQQKQEQEITRMKDAYEKEALRSQLEIQENTLKTIAQELHDNIGQMLSVVKLSLSVVPLDNDDKAYEPIRSSQEILNKAIFDLSNLTKSLHTERIVDIGLAESIRYELIAIKKAGILDVQYNDDGPEWPFGEQKAVFLFRMFQEALNNILKHAKATELIVNLSYANNVCRLEIKDNGRGFNIPGQHHFASSGSGVGLRSLYNRASIIGAEISICSAPGSGTTILIQLPFGDEE
ncbi:MAG TPA: sensor histidine kinase [Chitinophagaceae bacterium]